MGIMMDNRDISWDTQPTMSWCALKWEITPNKSNNGNFKRNMTINHVGLAFRQTHVYFYQNSRNRTSRDHMTLPPSDFLCHGEWLPICCLMVEKWGWSHGFKTVTRVNKKSSAESMSNVCATKAFPSLWLHFCLASFLL